MYLLMSPHKIQLLLNYLHFTGYQVHNNPLESVKQYTLNIDITNPSNKFNKQNKNFARAAHFFVGFFFLFYTTTTQKSLN